MYYYITPNYNVALNAKVGSSTIARSIIKEFYPDINKKILNIKNPPHISETDRQWHHLCPGTSDPNKPIILFVREPIERFVSACQQIGILDHNKKELINSLINDDYFIKTKYSNILLPNRQEEINKIDKINDKRLKEREHKIKNNLKVMPKFKRYGFIRDDVHFFHQYRYIKIYAYCFKFPDDFIDGLKLIGIKQDILHSNKAKRFKITLSDQEKNTIQEYYKKDIELFNLITEPGKLIKLQGELLCH